MGVRAYVPSVGRFTAVDPVPGGSANPYDYAGQDPVNRMDPAGTCETWVTNKALRATQSGEIAHGIFDLTGHVRCGRTVKSVHIYVQITLSRDSLNYSTRIPDERSVSGNYCPGLHHGCAVTRHTNIYVTPVPPCGSSPAVTRLSVRVWGDFRRNGKRTRFEDVHTVPVIFEHACG
jgi:hypothetical protein